MFSHLEVYVSVKQYFMPILENYPAKRQKRAIGGSRESYWPSIIRYIENPIPPGFPQIELGIVYFYGRIYLFMLEDTHVPEDEQPSCTN